MLHSFNVKQSSGQKCTSFSNSRIFFAVRWLNTKGYFWVKTQNHSSCSDSELLICPNEFVLISFSMCGPILMLMILPDLHLQVFTPMKATVVPIIVDYSHCDATFLIFDLKVKWRESRRFEFL